MVADQNSPTGNNNSIGVEGTPVTSTVTRGGHGRVEVGLAKYNTLSRWQPKLTDFIIWHGWLWGRWYGIVNGINGDNVRIIKDGLPYLLFTMNQQQHDKSTIEIHMGTIRNGRSGEYHILQDGTWYV